MEKPESAVVISGIGTSDIGRRLFRDPLELTAQACLNAIGDAGLMPDDIDGLSTYPGATWSTPGLTGAGVDEARALLGLRLRWHTGGGEIPGQLGSIVNATLAVAGGLANHALCFRTVWESTAQERAGSRASVVGSTTRNYATWHTPYGAGHPTYGALAMSRYFHESGATREQFAQLAVVSRANAKLNPQAVYRDPMTVDDYLSSRMISDPLCIYDCDVPVDGSVAFVVSRRASSSVDLSRAIRIEAIGSASGTGASAAMLWSRTDLKPADVQVAELYDGFTILTVEWLEALGLTPRYETGSFIEGGTRIALDGDLPISTGGGQLSGGRLHGFGGLLQACIQLRGEAGIRQVKGPPEVAAVSCGTALFTSCLLLTR
jgi:acetyl-CoA acetyltransferase